MPQAQKDRQQALEELKTNVRKMVKEETERIEAQVSFLRDVLESRGITSLLRSNLSKLSKSTVKTLDSLVGIEVKQ